MVLRVEPAKSLVVPKIPGSRLWGRLRRRGAAELRAAFDVLRGEPHGVRTAYRLIRTAFRYRIYPHDALLYELDRRPAADGRDYLNKRTLMRLQNVLNPAAHHRRVLNKLDYHVGCAARGVPVPPVLAVVDFGPDDGRCAKLSAVRIEGVADMAGFLGALSPGSRIIFKSIAGTYAHGLLGVTVDADGAFDHDGRRVDAAAVLGHCEARRKEGGFIVQPWLEPHPALRPLMPGRGLGTVRIITFLMGDQVQVPFAFVKIPVGTIIYDAFNHGKTGNLLARVDAADGTLGIAWGPSPTHQRRLATYAAHPDTGAAIEGFRIPCWPEVLRTVAAGARAFPELKTLGWDVAVTSDGVFLLEANHHWDPEGPQLLLRRGFRPDMEALVAQACER
jgi:hypothetical protein